MSTATVLPVSQKVPKLPKLSPWMAPNLICPNKGCQQVLTPRIAQSKEGGEPSLVYDCEPCAYSFQMSLQHANGQPFPIGKFGVRPKEVFEK